MSYASYNYKNTALLNATMNVFIQQKISVCITHRDKEKKNGVESSTRTPSGPSKKRRRILNSAPFRAE